MADRLCGRQKDPIVLQRPRERPTNLQIKRWLEARKYENVTGKTSTRNNAALELFAFRLIVPGLGLDGEAEPVNIPIDAVVMPRQGEAVSHFSLVKSAGDFTNVNKRRKEEATKVAMLRESREARCLTILSSYAATSIDDEIVAGCRRACAGAANVRDSLILVSAPARFTPRCSSMSLRGGLKPPKDSKSSALR